MAREAPRVFLLSPARLDGERARLLFRPVTAFPLAAALRSKEGAPIGEVFRFLSGLYFRGKLAYAEAFARPPKKSDGVLVITTNRGLLPASTRVRVDDLARFAETDIHHTSDAFRGPLARDAETLARALGARGELVLLGSIATMLLGLALSLLPSLALIVVGLVVFTTGFFGAHSIALGLVSRRAHPGSRSLAPSLYYLGYYGGSTLIGWAGGLAFASGGWAGTAAMIAAVLILAASLAWLHAVRRGGLGLVDSQPEP